MEKEGYLGGSIDCFDVDGVKFYFDK